MKFLISETTKEERLRLVKRAIAIGSLDCPHPNEYIKGLFQDYIDGKKEISELEKIVGISR